MKFDAEQIQIDDNEVIVSFMEQRKGIKRIGVITPKIDGGKIFIYDPSRKLLGHAKITYPDEVDINGKTSSPRIDIQPGCVYLEALNIKNAERRLLKGKILFWT